eukprot:CAMPEP_0206300044 /NCGR_PEP_ID=MMETSP0106_2-20121207/7498_1 /ASSEMBLY_ACC=CAM_ASM_000206 /TAXON_ID=81532 /ORGANISM="Acanthoeca-like sp., Strain 10tr" /LENGTH=162 /DNA_ID=CAMNT_0053730755 /DNA_START=348 /DNA_END=833 /DNA_ORIENTATION=-
MTGVRLALGPSTLAMVTFGLSLAVLWAPASIEAQPLPEPPRSTVTPASDAPELTDEGDTDGSGDLTTPRTCTDGPDCDVLVGILGCAQSSGVAAACRLSCGGCTAAPTAAPTVTPSRTPTSAPTRPTCSGVLDPQPECTRLFAALNCSNAVVAATCPAGCDR